MHTFRFNPVFNQWVLLGTSQSSAPQITEANLLDVGRKKEFVAAHNPRQPFLLEPEPQSANAHADEVYASQSPVGEYEFLLYRGDLDFFTWRAEEWRHWLELAHQRTLQTHHNPHLHFVHLSLNTASRHTIDGYQRVGDLIAASHSLCEMSTLIPTELAEKMRNKEKIFQLHSDHWLRVFAPTAPLHDREVWIVPVDYRPSFVGMSSEERWALAEVLSNLFVHLKSTFSHDEYQLSLHTALVDNSTDKTWWIQIHKAEGSVESPIPVRPLPELFMKKLTDSLRNT